MLISHADGIAAACETTVYRHVHASVDTALDVTNDFLVFALS